MTARERWEELGNGEPLMLIDDPAYCESFIGTVEMSELRAVYDYDKMVEEYSAFYDCNPDEAMEWIDYNVVRALPYFGSGAPIIINRLPE